MKRSSAKSDQTSGGGGNNVANTINCGDMQSIVQAEFLVWGDISDRRIDAQQGVCLSRHSHRGAAVLCEPVGCNLDPSHVKPRGWKPMGGKCCMRMQRGRGLSLPCI